jgi:hypothetical protein
MTTIAFNPINQAKFWARAHVESDSAIKEVWYLPEGADDREIRLVEVNDSLSEFVDDALEAVEFGIDRELDTRHQLLVLDVTPDQWRRIQSKELRLPAGWGLGGVQRLQPRNSKVT